MLTSKPTLLPKITIANVPLSSPEDLIASIRAKNSMLSDVPEADLKLFFISKPKHGRSHAVLGVSPQVRQKIRQEGDRLFIHLQSCRVYDRYWVARCTSCCGLGHKSARCPNLTPVCGQCTGTHVTSACTNHHAAKCVNCSKHGRPAAHSAFSPRCPSLIAVRNSIRSRTMSVLSSPSAAVLPPRSTSTDTTPC